MNTGIIGLENTKFTINLFFLMAGIAAAVKSISAAKKITAGGEKKSKGCGGPDDNRFNGVEPKGGNPTHKP
ncbi:hypothetical protein [Dryocola clanedunensis]